MLSAALRRTIALAFCLAAMLFYHGFLTGRAQNGATAELKSLQTDQFPGINTLFEVYDAAGNFVHKLRPDQITIWENGQALPVDQLEEIQPGIQFVLAITYGYEMGIRDGLGMSRYDYLLSGLSQMGWETIAQSNDLSILLDQGPAVLHTTEPQMLLDALQTYQVNPRTAQPNLNILDQAVQIALDNNTETGMEPAVLFISPPLEKDMLIGLQSLMQRAQQRGVRVSIWLISSTDLLDSSQARQMKTLAEDTGGQFFHYTGSETFPRLEQHLQELQYTYSLTYTSEIIATGTYTVAVQIQTPDFDITTAGKALSLEIQSPNPMFVGLAASIERSLPSDSAEVEKTVFFDSLTPQKVEIRVLVEFPDRLSREIVRSALYVDEQAVEKRLEAPFDQFTWDLTPYTQTGIHQVRVEVMDELGLLGSSQQVPVEVIVEQPRSLLPDYFQSHNILIVVGTALAAILIMALILVLGGRIKPTIPGRGATSQQKRTFRVVKPGKTRSADTRPAQTVSQGQISQPRMERHHWLRRQPAAKAMAYLIPLVEPEDNSANSPIPIIADEVSFGADPARATWALRHPALEPVHTRMRREGNTFRLLDEGTIAGTYINYSPVTPEGNLLEHGDLIHIGPLGFRLTLLGAAARKPVIIPLETHHDPL